MRPARLSSHACKSCLDRAAKYACLHLQCKAKNPMSSDWIFEMPIAQRWLLISMIVQVVRHIESWSVSGTEAILQLFRPSSSKMQR